MRASRKPGGVYWFKSGELTLIRDKEHCLYDPRVTNAPDPTLKAMYLNREDVPAIIVRFAGVGRNGVEVYEIVDGRQRDIAFEAAAKQDPDVKIRAEVRTLTDEEAIALMWSSGARTISKPTQIADLLHRLVNKFGMPRKKAAEMRHLSERMADHYLNIAAAPKCVREAVDAKEIAIAVASKLAGLSADAALFELDGIKMNGARGSDALDAAQEAADEHRPGKRRGTVRAPGEVARPMRPLKPTVLFAIRDEFKTALPKSKHSDGGDGMLVHVTSAVLDFAAGDASALKRMPLAVRNIIEAATAKKEAAPKGKRAKDGAA